MTQTRRYASYWLIGLVLTLFTFISDPKVQSSQNCIPPPPGLVSWWPGDGNASDIVDGNTPNQTLGAPQFVTAKVGQGFQFDGDDGYVAPDNPNLNFGATGSFTIDAWFRVDGVNPVGFGQNTLIDKRAPTPPNHQRGYVMSVLHSSHPEGPPVGFFIQFQIKEDDINFVTVSTNAITDNDFHFIAAVVNRANQTMSIYLDGVLQQQQSIAIVGDISNDKRLFIGHHTLDVLTGLRPFRGVLDEVEIFSRALADSEIQAIYNAGSAGKCKSTAQICVPPPPGLVSWWPGDGDANDITDGNHGTLQNGAAFASGKVGQAFSMDGVDDYIQFGDILDGLSIGFTLDAWVRTTATVGNKAIIAKYWTTGSSWVIRTNESDPGKVDFTVCSPDCASLANAVQLVSISNINDGEWHFIAATFDGTTQRLYIDGILEASGTNTNPAWTDNHHFCIGSFCDPSGNSFLTFGGLIDEVEVFNRALTAGEIAAIYHAGSAGKCRNRVLIADADSFLRSGANNTNEGASERLRIQSSGHNRALVQFDLSSISTAGLQSATLVLNLAENSNNWGSSGRLVDVHPLLEDWTEGNGHNAVMVSGVPTFRGSGQGVTWHCASDADISNQQSNCASLWNGGAFASATAAGVLHTNGLLGEVSWDVTTDVMAGANFGWLIKKREEGQPGQVRYFSREGAARVGDVSLAPRLILVYTQ